MYHTYIYIFVVFELHWSLTHWLPTYSMSTVMHKWSQCPFPAQPYPRKEWHREYVCASPGCEITQCIHTWHDVTGQDMTYAYQYHPPKLTHSSHYLGFYLALVVVYLDLWMIPTVCLYIKHLLVHTVHTSKAIYSIWARSAIAGRKIIVFTQPVTTGDLPSIREIPTFTAWIGLWPGEEENGDCAWGAMNS